MYVIFGMWRHLSPFVYSRLQLTFYSNITDEAALVSSSRKPYYANAIEQYGHHSPSPSPPLPCHDNSCCAKVKYCTPCLLLQSTLTWTIDVYWHAKQTSSLGGSLMVKLTNAGWRSLYIRCRLCYGWFVPTKRKHISHDSSLSTNRPFFGGAEHLRLRLTHDVYHPSQTRQSEGKKDFCFYLRTQALVYYHSVVLPCRACESQHVSGLVPRMRRARAQPVDRLTLIVSFLFAIQKWRSPQ